MNVPTAARTLAVSSALALTLGSVPTLASDETGIPSDDPFPDVRGPSHLGVIVPAGKAAGDAPHFGVEPSSYWTPGADDIAALESRLRPALEAGQRDPETIGARLGDGSRRDYVARQVGLVLERLETSRRQYIGIVLKDGGKRILVSGFPGAESAASDGFAYWRRHVVWVMDGGATFWRIQYIVADGSFTGFDSNGYA